MDNENNENKKAGPNVSTKTPRTMKMLSENKLKRLNILTFINEKKEILFTKKAFKFEKERIWRQIFHMMRDSGMVSPEKDWRYVRDVSFSNWRKRAQKRLKHLTAKGYRLEMDECQFLISDLLGQTPDKTKVNLKTLEERVLQSNAEEIDEEMDDDESDEYMIDSDEDDEMYNEMLLIPKVVINENDNAQSYKLNEDGILTSLPGGTAKSKAKNPMANQQHTVPINSNHKNTKSNSNTSQLNGYITNGGRTGKTNHELNSSSSNDLKINEFENKRIVELDIENKLLKNRYMKLKIFKMEKDLGVEHCSEVKELNSIQKSRQ